MSNTVTQDTLAIGSNKGVKGKSTYCDVGDNFVGFGGLMEAGIILFILLVCHLVYVSFVVFQRHQHPCSNGFCGDYID
jgi:hypothetical protein